MEPTLTQVLLIGLIQMFAQGLEAITGFGSTVIAVPFIQMVVPLETAIAVSVAHTWLLVIYVVFVSRKNIVWKEFGFIALYVLLGLPFGYFLFKNLDDTYLKGILASFMIGVGFYGIYTTRRSRLTESVATVRKSHLMRFILFLGGIIHGAFGTGGPFVVIYAAQALKDKTLFRVCLCLLWLSMNTILMTAWTIDGVWVRNDGFTLKILIATLPFLFVGIVVGNYLHHRVSEHAFRLLMYALLLAAGFVVVYGFITSI